MSTRPSLRLRALHIEGLKIQQEHLLVLRDRHRVWIAEGDDLEINRNHRDIIDLIDKTVVQYAHLLEALQSQGAGEQEEFHP